MLPIDVVRYGSDSALTEQIPLRAGPLTMLFEDGGLRYIRLDGHEAIRRIYVAVRDANWDTVPNQISNVELMRGDRSFEITYDVENRHAPIHFRWSARISGNEHGSVVFTMRGKALTPFLRNRIGFCVLHPVPECAGRACNVVHSDGTSEAGTFPLYIAPHQPFVDMRAISHEVRPGRSVDVSFEGDIFEMEDQRNWTDASYKTYCTPLHLPFPVEVTAGTEIAQDIRITAAGTPKVVGTVRNPDEPVLFQVGGEPAPLPAIGTAVNSDGNPLTPTQVERIASLRLSHLRIDLDLASTENRQALSRTAAAALPLEIAVFLGAEPEAELTRLLEDLAAAHPAIARWLIFHKAEKSTSSKWINLAREHLRRYDASAPIVSGTNAYFAELNRGRPDPSQIDGACFSINPQVHAFDNDSLVETLSAQAATVESLRQFAGSVPVYVSPVTLKPRFNPNATGAEPPRNQSDLPPEVDQRQMSLIGAGWTLGSIKYLAEAGAAGITYYETTGWRGIMETEKGSRLPQTFRSIPGSVFPLYHVLADFGAFKGGEILKSSSSESLQVDGAVLRSGTRMAILLANLRPVDRTIRVEGGNLDSGCTLRMLDETNVESAMRDPERFREQDGVPIRAHAGAVTVPLRPYAFARLDVRRGEKPDE